MAKKASSKRGYMTKAEVGEHLKGKDAKGKISYLQNILIKKPRLLNEKTKYALYETLGDLYNQQKEYATAATAYMKAGKRQKASEEAIKAIESTRPGERYSKPADILHKLGETDKAAEALRKIEKYEASAIAWKQAAIDAKRAGHNDVAMRYLANAREDSERLEAVKETSKEIIKGRERVFGELERTAAAATAALVGIFGGFYFFTPNITGNAIGSLSSTGSNWIGGILFIIGILALLCHRRWK
jgi:tetratricopeptide (TPR) repeat protein